MTGPTMSEQTDVREMASLLAMLETAADPEQAAMMSPYAIAGMAHRAAAALERLETRIDWMQAALEEIAHDGCQLQHGELKCYDRMGAPDWSPCFPCLADRALATPAPTEQTGGET